MTSEKTMRFRLVAIATKQRDCQRMTTTPRHKPGLTCVLRSMIFAAFAAVAIHMAAGAPISRHEAVLDLNPVGYWPADEGEVLRDLSSTQNHGVIHHVPWDKERNLLDFTGAYQWLEIPANKAYQSDSFSIGGWVFLRSQVVGSGWPNRQGMDFIRNANSRDRSGIVISIRKQELLDVVSGHTEDVLGTRLWNWEKYIGEGKPQLSIGNWHHILYTFETKEQGVPCSDTKNLALDAIISASAGEVVKMTDSVAWNIGREEEAKTGNNFRVDFDGETTANRIKLIGSGPTEYVEGKLYFSDGTMLWVRGSTNKPFDVLFNDKKVTWLRYEANPTASPGRGAGLKDFGVYKSNIWINQQEGVVYNAELGLRLTGKGSLYLDGKEIASKDGVVYKKSNEKILVGNDSWWWLQMTSKSGSLDGAVRDLVWFDREISPSEVTFLSNATRPEAVPVVYDDKNEAATTAKRKSVEQLIAIMNSTNQAEKSRAEAVLALGAIGKEAKAAVPGLVKILHEFQEKNDGRLPRVEDFLCNAAARTLLDIAPEDTQARDILGRILAKPLFAMIDMNQQYLSGVKALVESKCYFEALEEFRKLNPESHGERFFSEHAVGKAGNYTATATANGCVYKVGTGKAWQGGEQVSQEEYVKILSRLSGKYPNAKDWRPLDFPRLYRVPIIKTYPDGREQKIYLGGEDFVFDGTDEKMLGWSLFIDKSGYVHLLGGQHNAPNPENYIPGAWEVFDVPRLNNNPDYPLQMYWVTKEPGNINTFEFVGRKSDPRVIPAGYLNYMVILQNNDHETFLYGRSEAYGWQCWGMYHYDWRDKKWDSIGGDPYDVIESARTHDAGWMKYLHDMARGEIPAKASDIKRLAWAWQPHFYNFCRDAWGAKFDKTGRMHVRMTINGLNESGYVKCSSVYAWSDDLGRTFHRIDGSSVKLPLTINPAPDHFADINYNSAKVRWDVWAGLLKTMGYSVQLLPAGNWSQTQNGQ